MNPNWCTGRSYLAFSKVYFVPDKRSTLTSSQRTAKSISPPTQTFITLRRRSIPCEMILKELDQISWCSHPKRQSKILAEFQKVLLVMRDQPIRFCSHRLGQDKFTRPGPQDGPGGINHFLIGRCNRVLGNFQQMSQLGECTWGFASDNIFTFAEHMRPHEQLDHSVDWNLEFV